MFSLNFIHKQACISGCSASNQFRYSSFTFVKHENVKTKPLMFRNKMTMRIVAGQFYRVVRLISFENSELIWLSSLRTADSAQFCQIVSRTLNICTVLPSSLSGAQPNTVLCCTSSNEMACSQELCFLTVFSCLKGLLYFGRVGLCGWLCMCKRNSNSHFGQESISSLNIRSV